MYFIEEIEAKYDRSPANVQIGGAADRKADYTDKTIKPQYTMKTYDAIIIGFGKGGKTLAADLGARGWQVAVIEQSDQMYGGTCINVGCIPTKTLVHQAKLATYRPEPTFGQRSEHYRRAIRRKEEVTALLRDKNYRNLADKPNITVYTGTGSFAGPDEVDVTFTADYPERRNAGTDPGTAGSTNATSGTATAKIPAGTAAGGYTKGEKLRLKADRIFINTGAETVIPPIAGVRESDRVYTSTSIMELEELPKRLVIVGGGYIGLEFASMYAEFGSQVTVLESYPELIPREDRDIAASVRATLEKRGVTFRLNTQVESVQDGKTCAYVTVRDSGNGAGSTGNRNTNNPTGSGTDGSRQVLEAEAVLLATGRKPNTAGLNLEAAGIRTDPRGSVMVDDRLQTTNPKVWALGDVKGGLQFTYISLDDYRIVRDELFGTGERKTQDRLPVAYAHRNQRRGGAPQGSGRPRQFDPRRIDPAHAHDRGNRRSAQGRNRCQDGRNSRLHALRTRIQRGDQHGRPCDEKREQSVPAARHDFYPPEHERSAQRPVQIIRSQIRRPAPVSGPGRPRPAASCAGGGIHGTFGEDFRGRHCNSGRETLPLWGHTRTAEQKNNGTIFARFPAGKSKSSYHEITSGYFQTE